MMDFGARLDDTRRSICMRSSKTGKGAVQVIKSQNPRSDTMEKAGSTASGTADVGGEQAGIGS